MLEELLDNKPGQALVRLHPSSERIFGGRRYLNRLNQRIEQADFSGSAGFFRAIGYACEVVGYSIVEGASRLGETAIRGTGELMGCIGSKINQGVEGMSLPEEGKKSRPWIEKLKGVCSWMSETYQRADQRVEEVPIGRRDF